MPKEVLYLSGPMTGYVNYNFDAFNREAKRLRKLGHKVFNPVESDCKDPNWKSHADSGDYSHFMEHDLPQVCRCTSVAVLPGWHRSKGARLEVYVGLQIGKPILWAETMKPVTDKFLRYAMAALPPIKNPNRKL